MKRPAFQFYPGDWLRDPALRMCSSASRGLWIDMICVMHQAHPYGHLVFNGNPVTASQLAKMVGETPADVTEMLAELQAAGVFSRDDNGVIYSRKMVRDELEREAWKNRQKNHRESHADVTPMSRDESRKCHAVLQSSSSSSKPKQQRVASEAFGRFWETWPTSNRKVAKAKCLQAWDLMGLDEAGDQIIAHVLAMKGSEQWTSGFEPAPLTYLNQRRWEDGPPPQRPGRGLAI